MASLARDIGFRPLRRVAVVRGRVIAIEFGRMAIGAHPVPVLVQAGPVQLVRRRDVLVRIEVIPARVLLSWEMTKFTWLPNQ